MRKPQYFFAMFGDLKPPAKDKVESGVYHPDSKYAPFAPEIGDILLIYCTSNYREHSTTSPGIGIVLDKDATSIAYRYLPFRRPVTKDDFEKSLMQEDRKKFGDRRFSARWLFEISRDSFLGVTANTAIEWP
jgi:hypothetical protein